MDRDRALREHLIALLDGEHAHVGFDRAVAEIPETSRGARIPNFPHSPWQLVEHLRIAQWDILQFSLDSNHVSPPFPEGYWPLEEAPPGPASWERSLAGFRDDLRTLKGCVADSSRDLWAPFAHGQGQTLLREVLLVADHNAYHLGQLVTVRRGLGIWKD